MELPLLHRRDSAPSGNGSSRSRERRSRRRASSPAHTEGTARLDRRTKQLIGRLKPGNVAIIDHDDLDRIAAESLLEHGVCAVVNARASISGRYPNLGPLVLVLAGVPLLDAVGQDVFERVSEGDHVRLEGSTLYLGDEAVAEGTLLDVTRIRERMDAAREQLSSTVERFAENTLDYVRREQDILLEGVRLPELRTRFKGRHALVVTRGYHYKEDLRTLRSYIQELRPVIVAVDGAADACLSEGFVPDVIFGDIDSVSPTALDCGAEILVHPPGDWRRRQLSGDDVEVPECVRTVEALGLTCQVVNAPGTSEDVAMLLAHEQGAELIVAVGSHTSAIEFLDKGREGMASTFLARLRIGPNLVDAKGVSQLYRPGVSVRHVGVLVVAALVTLLIVASISRPARLFWLALWELITQTAFTVKTWF